jgi:hypothetical protein
MPQQGADMKGFVGLSVLLSLISGNVVLANEMMAWAFAWDAQSKG